MVQGHDVEVPQQTFSVDFCDVEYVLWVEQHHVTGGHGVNLKQLLEQAIMQFKTNRELYNDERYVGIWMRYAVQSPEPLTLFKAMYEMQVGVQQAQFFATWAQHLEASGDTRGASRVLRKGIDLRASPTCLLEGALRHLEARTSRQVALDVQQQQCQESAFVGGQQDARSVLAPLRPQGKQGTAPLIRTGRAARPAEQQPGGLAIVTTGSTAGNRGHTKVRVQADENAPPDALLVQPVAAPPFVTTAQLTKENSRAAGKWSGVTVKQHVPSASTQQSFDVLEEQGSQPAPWLSASPQRAQEDCGFNEFSCWDTWEVPLFKPDPPDLLVRPMYDKASVYRGTTEFQFEEIRMANIRARQRQRWPLSQWSGSWSWSETDAYSGNWSNSCIRSGSSTKQDDQVEALKREVQQLHEELEKLRSLLAQSRTGTREHAIMTSQVVHLERSILVAEQSILGRPVLGGGLGDEEVLRRRENLSRWRRAAGKRAPPTRR
ncbi:hypothetical protein HPB50_017240 [Hyalomma asiaticum]|uniref:Uncharacterized protein n=1 Tax=Hyalomma asiaticum TaxID=266040 RepID=A0ACB7RV56_HYAAI|nr:hypothetical protein HPB50_017240 [Hyalomma asiaticum]